MALAVVRNEFYMYYMHCLVLENLDESKRSSFIFEMDAVSYLCQAER
jgi:hypothetical protein